MSWNHRTTRRDRKRRNTPRCRGLNRVHVVHFDDAAQMPDRLAHRAIRWPIRCIICKRIIHHSPIFSWEDSLRGNIFVSRGPARFGAKPWYDFACETIPTVTRLVLRVQAPPQRATIVLSGYPEP